MKIPSKARADCIKKYLPFISLNQTGFVEGRFISIGRRLTNLRYLTSNRFLEIEKVSTNNGYSNAFDSVNHLFLITALKKMIKHFLSVTEIL